MWHECACHHSYFIHLVRGSVTLSIGHPRRCYCRVVVTAFTQSATASSLQHTVCMLSAGASHPCGPITDSNTVTINTADCFDHPWAPSRRRLPCPGLSRSRARCTQRSSCRPSSEASRPCGIVAHGPVRCRLVLGRHVRTFDLGGTPACAPARASISLGNAAERRLFVAATPGPRRTAARRTACTHAHRGGGSVV